jgi:hypothetical protein
MILKKVAIVGMLLGSLSASCLADTKQITGSVQKSDVTSKKKSRSTTLDYSIPILARYMEMDNDQYLRFSHAIVANYIAIEKGPGFDLQKHPALIQMTQLRDNGQEISESLFNEVKEAFSAYNKGMADYVGISVEEFNNAEVKHFRLTEVLDGLTFAEGELALGLPIVTSLSAGEENEEVEVIVVTAKAPVIRRTSLGGFTILSADIQQQALDKFSIFQSRGIFRVNFNLPDGTFVGTQNFLVTQGFITPASPLVTSPTCENGCSEVQF